MVSFNSVQSAEPQNEKKNIKSGKHQSNEPNRNDTNSSGNTDEFAVLESPKTEYTRSLLMNLGNPISSGHQPLTTNENVTRSIDTKIWRNNPNEFNWNDKTNETGLNFNDDFWSNATERNREPFESLRYNRPKGEPMLPSTSELNIHAAVRQAALISDAMNEQVIATAKVDRWLHSGLDPSEYAFRTEFTAPQAKQQFDLTTNTSSTIKADEMSSTVSNQSAIRAKLLEKTAKVKQNLRKFSNNQN